MAGDRMAFLREFARAPLDVGAVAPSGRALTSSVTRDVPRRPDALVVELGRFRRLVGATFPDVTIGRTIWANLPPAYVYSCRSLPRCA